MLVMPIGCILPRVEPEIRKRFVKNLVSTPKIAGIPNDVQVLNMFVCDELRILNLIR